MNFLNIKENQVLLQEHFTFIAKVLHFCNKYEILKNFVE